MNVTTSTMESTRALGAPLFTILLGVIVLLLDLGRSDVARRRLLPLVSIVGLLGAGLMAWSSASGSGTSMTGSDIGSYFGGGAIIDPLGGLFCLVLTLVAAFAIGMAPGYLEEKGLNQGEFYALILFSTSGAMLMALANDLVNVFVGLEVLSVALYILSGFARRERRSEESAVKYFLLGAFASGFLLYGIALIYGSVGLTAQAQGLPSTGGVVSYTNFVTIADTLRLSSHGTVEQSLAGSPLFIAGIGFLIVGLGFKAAIVPFHSYAPDVYEGAPTPVTAFMSVAAKAGSFAAFIRLFQVLAEAHGVGPYRAVLWGLAAATMIVGNVLAVRQTGIKRMLAYSSIAHAGYILVGVLATTGAAGAGEIAREAIRFYLFAYTFMNLGAFAVIVWLGQNGGEYRDIRDYDGLGKRQPLAAAILSIFLLSLAGIPLTAGFLGKLTLFVSAIRAGDTALAVLGLIVSAIGVFYYLNVIVAMYFREPKYEFAAPRAGGARTVAVIAAVLTLVFGILPIPKLGPSVGIAVAPLQGTPTILPSAPVKVNLIENPSQRPRGKVSGGATPVEGP